MSQKSVCGESTDLNSSEETKHVNESLLKKLNDIFLMILEHNKTSNEYEEKLLSQKNMSFSSNHIPKISIKNYLKRILNYTEVEESTLIIALIYIDRLNQLSKVILTPYNIHRLIFIAIFIAIKYNEDITFNFDYYAQVSGMSIKELQLIEIEFIYLIKFRLYIDKEQYDSYLNVLGGLDFNGFNSIEQANYRAKCERVNQAIQEAGRWIDNK